MSFVTTIRDYVETLNSVTEALNQNLTVPTFVSQTLLYSLKTLQTGFLYILSFQWIRDFSLLPIVLPQVSASIFRETFVLENPSTVFFDFLEIPDLHQNTFLLGFFNSFFLALPISVLHLVTVRRLIIQGVPAAVWSMGGYLGGQLLFITCTLFGVRSLLIPWLTLEPLNYLLGVILLFRIVYAMVKESLVPLKGWSLGSSPKYKEFLVTSFLLAWCEQTSIFQYLGNLTVSSNVTILETFSTTSSVSSGFTHFFYILGLSFGSVFFTVCWGLFFLKLKEAVVVYTPMFLSTFMQKLNKTTFVVALALSFTSIPFYGFEYVLTGPLGFISQDSVFKNTPFDEIRAKDYEKVGSLSGPETNNRYVHFDPAPFDRGEYLTGPRVDQPESFEDLNYRGEFMWMTRSDRMENLLNKKTGLLSLGNVFKNYPKRKPTTGVSEVQTLENPLFSKRQPGIQSLFFEDDASTTVKRFVNESSLDLESEDKPYRELYLKSFPHDFLRKKGLHDKEVEHQIKRKYYSNPVYKSLLTVDIDSLLNRQPKHFRLTSEQEGDLFLKRRMLESYYDSLRHYSKLPYVENEFDTFFDGTKSFSSKVYNQQFKGTFRSVRRLFSLTLNNDDDVKNSRQKVLKFDQPQYDFSENGSFSAYHEELEAQGKEIDTQLPTLPFVLNKPLYAGWDEHTRKFVITNKLLPRQLAGYKVNVEPQIRNQFVKGTQKQTQKLRFTAWPLTLDQVSTSKTEIPYVTLFKSVNKETFRAIFGPGAEKSDFQPTFLPANLKRFELDLQGKERQRNMDLYPSLAPKRGGFVWPGNSDLNVSALNFSNFFKLK